MRINATRLEATNPEYRASPREKRKDLSSNRVAWMKFDNFEFSTALIDGIRPALDRLTASNAVRRATRLNRLIASPQTSFFTANLLAHL